MDLFYPCDAARRGAARHKLEIFFFWLVGLLVGIVCASRIEEASFSLMRLTVESRVSIVSLLSSVLLPFLMCVICFLFSVPRLVFAVCFFRSALYGFAAFAVTRCYGAAGWLIRSLFLFSGTCTMPALIWLCVRHVDGVRNSFWRDVLLCAGFAVVIGILEVCCIMPFLVQLLSFPES